MARLAAVRELVLRIKHDILGCTADFTNLLSPIHLQEIAEADALQEQIHGVHVSMVPDFNWRS